MESTSQRPTKEIKLNMSGLTVTLYEYITGRDKRSIEAVYLEAAEVTSKRKGSGEGEVEINGVKGTATHFMLNAAISAVVKSIKPEGAEAEITDKKKILDFILDQIPEADYDQVVVAVNEITEPKKA